MTLEQIDRYDAKQSSTRGQRAVVVGGSMAGLCAARVLRDWFETVVVVERDEFPAAPERRDGAPQTSQPHGMLEAGRVTLNDLFPGFDDDVRTAGGLKLDMTADLRWYNKGGVVADADEGLPALYASRPLFEHVVRERVRAFDGIRLRGGCAVFDYTHDPEAGRVTGVRFRDEAGNEATFAADLVVDATGRTSRTPRWLGDHGYPAPDTSEVTVDVTYSTVRIERPSEARSGVLVAPEPHRPRGMAMLPIEENQWEVVLQGMHGERAPSDRETFLKWADAMPIDEIARQLRSQQWQSDCCQYPFPASVWTHYERLDRFPDGLVVTGDAIASFNPIYGQGMSVAALDALVLHHELADGLHGLGTRFFNQTSDVVDEAWKLAVGNDFVFEATTGDKPFGTDVFNRYVTRLLRRAHDDGVLTREFFRVFRLEQSVTSLLHPAVVWRVVRPRLGAAGASASEA